MRRGGAYCCRGMGSGCAQYTAAAAAADDAGDDGNALECNRSGDGDSKGGTCGWVAAVVAAAAAADDDDDDDDVDNIGDDDGCGEDNGGGDNDDDDDDDGINGERRLERESGSLLCSEVGMQD